MVVSPEGTATDVKIVKSLDKGLDENAVEAVRQWKFKPGLKAGKPVPVIAKVEINFRLLEKPPEPPAAPAPPAPEPESQVAPKPAPAPEPMVAPEPPEPPDSPSSAGTARGTTGVSASANGPEEMERRQRYVADRFGGADTDRGKAYLRYGPPDEIESHPSTGVENWRYNDAAKKKPVLDLSFQNGKQVGSSKHTSTSTTGTAAGVSPREKTLVKAAELKRRQEYAKQHFGGENTDRGKVYVRYGPPDEIDSQASQGKRVDIWRYKDNSNAKVMLEIEFQDGKQVKRTGALTTGQ
jgi:TonB family protein